MANKGTLGGQVIDSHVVTLLTLDFWNVCLFEADHWHKMDFELRAENGEEMRTS